MKKVININFQGRVIPIEEPAYDELRSYIESLRKYFDGEEGRDEIINDIENRIAELFAQCLQKGASECITEADLKQIIGSIGRPEDFDQDLTDNVQASANETDKKTPSSNTEPKSSFYRNNNDKVLGGVCSGLAYYLRIDPTIVRVLFALITFGGFGTGFLLYLILWIVVPAKALSSNIRRRLFRNPDEKVLGGVCSGLASYFNVPIWIPRLVFVSPVIISALGGILSSPFSWFPEIISIPFGGTLFLAYIILWIVVPQAKTASEKLEMRGEKVDLENIRNTVQEELSGLKDNYEKAAPKIEERMKAWGKEVEESANQLTGKVRPATSNAWMTLGRIIVILIKFFVYFILGIIAFALSMASIAIIMAGHALYPLKDFFLINNSQNLAAAGVIFLFLMLPVIGILTWLIRRITGMRSKHSYLGWIFGILWVAGWISLLSLISMKFSDFKRIAEVQQEIAISQPTTGKLDFELGTTPGNFYPMDFVDFEKDEYPILNKNQDSLLLNTVKIEITSSPDSLFHLQMIRMASDRTVQAAEKIASKIQFSIHQKDSVIELQKGFSISQNDGFKNQKLILQLEVPEGKAFRINDDIDWLNWLSTNINDSERARWYIQKYRNREFLDWEYGEWYIMKDGKLKNMNKPTNNTKDDIQTEVKEITRIKIRDIEVNHAYQTSILLIKKKMMARRQHHPRFTQG